MRASFRIAGNGLDGGKLENHGGSSVYFQSCCRSFFFAEEKPDQRNAGISKAQDSEAASLVCWLSPVTAAGRDRM